MCSCENGAAHIRDVSRAAKRREQVIAGALAPAALLGGQTAVLTVMRVTLALRGARATGGEACLKRRELRVRSGSVWRLRMRPASTHASAQSRQSRMQRASASISGSARHASAQIVHIAAHAAHSSMHAAMLENPSCSVWGATGRRAGLSDDQRGSVGVVHDRA
jgi:hypothetical protein